jgi:hypothetical protein
MSLSLNSETPSFGSSRSCMGMGFIHPKHQGWNRTKLLRTGHRFHLETTGNRQCSCCCGQLTAPPAEFLKHFIALRFERKFPAKGYAEPGSVGKLWWEIYHAKVLLQVSVGPELWWDIRTPVQTQTIHSETHGLHRKQDFNGCLAKWGALWVSTPKEIASIIFSSAQVPPPAPHWLSTMGCTFFL